MNIPYVFQNGQTADGSHVSSNFTACKDAIDALTSNATHTGDVTGDTALTIGEGKVLEGMIGSAAVAASKLKADINTKVLVGGTVVTITDGATPDINWSSGATQKITLGGNRTFNTPTNPVAGQVYRLILIQDATGSRTMTWWASTIKWAGGSAPTLTTTANKADIITLLYTTPNGTNYYYYASATLNF
jgi:hypothetical protein